MRIPGTLRSVLYRLLGSALLLSIAGASFGRPVESSSALVYHLRIDHIRRFHVTLHVSDPPQPHLDIAIPAWTPGYYQILHFEAGLQNIAAHDADGRLLPLTHPEPRTWSVPLPSRATAVDIDYDVNADDEGLGFFGAQLDEKRGYINGASVFLYVVGRMNAPIALSLRYPKDWKLATPLHAARSPVAHTDPMESVQYTDLAADNYDALVDCPIQLGQFAILPFRRDGVHYRCILVGNEEADSEKLIGALSAITHSTVVLFGNHPFDHYDFIFHIGGGGFYGGLEHCNATVIHLPFAIKAGDSDEFLATAAHEFFHAWNVKRLKPLGLGPFDYTQPVRSPSLWFAEGVTDYYASRLLVRSGLRSSEWFLNDMATRMAELEYALARRRISLEEASRKAWEGGSMGFDGLDYYLKGSLAGFYLDLEIREATHNRRTLDDVMRRLYHRYGKSAEGYPPEAVIKMIDTVAGKSLDADYARYIQGTGDFLWQEVLPPAGLVLQREPKAHLGITFDESETSAPPTNSAASGLPITEVEPDSEAASIGIQSGDTLLSLTWEGVSSHKLMECLHSLPPGVPITLTLRRDGKSFTLMGDSGIRYVHYELHESKGVPFDVTR